MAVPGGSEAMPDGQEVLRPWAEPEAGSQHRGQCQESIWMLLSTMDSARVGVGDKMGRKSKKEELYVYI